MIKPHFSRLTRFEEKKAYRRLFLNLLGISLIIFALIFFGIPLIIRLSLFLSNLKTNNQTSLVSDTIPPLPPRLETPYTATNSAKIALKGYAEINSTVEVFLNDQLIENISVGNNGEFEILQVFLREGENKIYAQAKDTVGNTSQKSEPITVIFKNTPPKIELNEPKDGENFNEETKEIIIKGITEPDVNLLINGRFVRVEEDGKFTYLLSLNPGENLIKIIATDIAGNQTSLERKVILNP